MDLTVVPTTAWKTNKKHHLKERSSSLLPYGDGGRSSPINQIEDWISGRSPRSSPTNIESAQQQSPRSTNIRSARALLPSSSSILRLYGAFILLSWILAAFMISQHTAVSWHEISDLSVRQKLHYEQTLDTLDDMKRDIKRQKALLKRWTKTKESLEHEMSVMHEVSEVNVHMFSLPDSPSKQLVDDWLFHRQGALQLQVDRLAAYLQKISKLAVLERYGPGPHRVRFTAELSARDQRSFVAELYPLAIMPHSVNFFLDLVSSHIWDDTVFLHHMDHVMATAPIDYYTHKIKHNHFFALGQANLGFPEHIEQYRHEKYTLGFAGQGPTFYLNTVDNSHVHGPGTQGHHLLPYDADPCFGRVVEGFDVVDDIVKQGMDRHRQSAALANLEGGKDKSQEDAVGSWDEAQRSWTHIVSVSIET